MLNTEVLQFDPAITAISCHGRFTMGAQLGEAEARINSLIESGARKVVLDLKHVNYVDSVGLGFIIRLFEEVEQCGGRFRLAGPAPQVRQLLEITHALQILPVDADLTRSVQVLRESDPSAGLRAAES